VDWIDIISHITDFASAGIEFVFVRSVVGEMRHKDYFITNLQPHFAAVTNVYLAFSSLITEQNRIDSGIFGELVQNVGKQIQKKGGR
jgi:hypothetical protein